MKKRVGLLVILQLILLMVIGLWVITSRRQKLSSINVEPKSRTCDVCSIVKSVGKNVCEVKDNMNDLKVILLSLALHDPFCFAHFNDGEILAITTQVGSTDRGMQDLSPELAHEMRLALQTDKVGMYFGLPSAHEFPNARKVALEMVTNSSKTQFVPATVLINQNFKVAHRAIVSLLRCRCVYMVTSDIANVTNFAVRTGIRLVHVVRIPAHNAFRDFEQLRDGWTDIPNGAVVLFCAGPLGRILAVQWYKHQPRATMLELGSFFDIELHGRSLGATYYTDSGNKPCNNNDNNTHTCQLSCLDQCSPPGVSQCSTK